MSKQNSAALLALMDTMMMDALTSDLPISGLPTSVIRAGWYPHEDRYVPPMPQKAKRKCLRRGCANDEVRNGFCGADCCRQHRIDKRGQR
jgi:hypothetical protein